MVEIIMVAYVSSENPSLCHHYNNTPYRDAISLFPDKWKKRVDKAIAYVNPSILVVSYLINE